MDYIRAWAEIDTVSFINNVRAIRKAIPDNTKMMAVVKADGYGHGSVQVAKAALENGANFLGVALCEEGIKLRQSGITAPILIMGYTPPSMFETAIQNELTQAIFNTDGHKELAKVAAMLNKKADVHIKVDTGMGRLGFLPNDQSIGKICDIINDPALNVSGIFTHFATADDLDTAFMEEQYIRFSNVLNSLKQQGVKVESLIKHAGNSGFLTQTVRSDKFSQTFLDMVRIGIILYGIPPSRDLIPTCEKMGLAPVMQLKARVSMVKTVPPGTGISYGQTFCTNRESIIATLPIGYADGYMRALSSKGKVYIKNHAVPIVGRVCMDQCMVDITEHPEAASIKPGEVATMFGTAGYTAEDAASDAGTIGYEVVCAVSKRVPRHYL